MKTIINQHVKLASLDDIIFENRNRNYGSYELRKNYDRHLLLGLIFTFSIILTAILITNLFINQVASKKPIDKNVTIDFDRAPVTEKPIIPPPPPVIGSLTNMVIYQVPVPVENPANEEIVLIDNDELPNIPTDSPIDRAGLIYYTEPTDNENTDIPYRTVTEPATFQGEDINSFGRWVLNNLKYTNETESLQLEGRLELQFVVNKDGAVDEVKVLRSIDPLIDNEAVSLIKKSPKWKPAKINGNIVRQIFTMPIVFKLQG